MKKKIRTQKAAADDPTSDATSSAGVLGAAEVKKVHGLLKSKTAEGVALGLALLESRGATLEDYEAVLTDAVIASVLNSWNADAWGTLANATKPHEALFNRVCDAVLKKREDIASMIRRGDVDHAVAIIRVVGVPALYEELLADCAVVTEGSCAGRITRNRLFDENEEHRTRALLQIAAYAPHSAAVSVRNVESLVIDVTHRQEHTGWHRYESKLVEHSVLKSLPEEIGKFINLTRLYLRNTAVETLPNSLGHLAQLRELEVVGESRPGKLQCLPESVGSLTNLRILQIEKNPLSDLPDTFGQLSALETMTLVKCGITELPQSFGQLGNLNTLTLSECSLESLPDSFGNLRNLKALNLSKCRITRLPESIGDLAALEKCDFSGMPLEVLPAAIGRLGGLRALDLSGCPITSMPDSIGDLCQLVELDLSGTAITKLPATIGRLGNLRKLVLPSGITDIPFEIGFLSLTEIRGGAGTTGLVLDVCRRAFEALHETPVIYLPDAFQEHDATVQPKASKRAVASKKTDGPLSDNERVKKRVDSLVDAVMPRCSTGRGADVLGPALWPLVDRGSPRAVVTFAFYSDILRMVHDLLVADGDAGDAELMRSYGIVSMIASGLFRTSATRLTYGDSSIEPVRRFLKGYKLDATPFGYANATTMWAGVKVCRNVATLFGDGKPFTEFTDSLVEWACEFSGQQGKNIEQDRVLQARRELWASL